MCRIRYIWVASFRKGRIGGEVEGDSATASRKIGTLFRSPDFRIPSLPIVLLLRLVNVPAHREEERNESSGRWKTGSVSFRRRRYPSRLLNRPANRRKTGMRSFHLSRSLLLFLLLLLPLATTPTRA